MAPIANKKDADAAAEEKRQRRKQSRVRPSVPSPAKAPLSDGLSWFWHLEKKQFQKKLPHIVDNKELLTEMYKIWEQMDEKARKPYNDMSKRGGRNKVLEVDLTEEDDN